MSAESMTPAEELEYLRAANATLLVRCGRLRRMIVGDTPDMEALRRLDLPRAEREILALLLRTRLEWVSQEEMLEVLAPRTEINSNSLQSHISKLRRRACVRIECARYLGYRLGEDDRRRLLGQLGMADPRHQEPP